MARYRQAPCACCGLGIVIGVLMASRIDSRPARARCDEGPYGALPAMTPRPDSRAPRPCGDRGRKPHSHAPRALPSRDQLHQSRGRHRHWREEGLAGVVSKGHQGCPALSPAHSSLLGSRCFSATRSLMIDRALAERPCGPAPRARTGPTSPLRTAARTWSPSCTWRTTASSGWKYSGLNPSREQALQALPGWLRP